LACGDPIAQDCIRLRDELADVTLTSQHSENISAGFFRTIMRCRGTASKKQSLARRDVGFVRTVTFDFGAQDSRREGQVRVRLRKLENRAVRAQLKSGKKLEHLRVA
jgi:hypothetical protein